MISPFDFSLRISEESGKKEKKDRQQNRGEGQKLNDITENVAIPFSEDQGENEPDEAKDRRAKPDHGGGQYKDGRSRPRKAYEREEQRPQGTKIHTERHVQGNKNEIADHAPQFFLVHSFTILRHHFRRLSSRP